MEIKIRSLKNKLTDKLLSESVWHETFCWKPIKVFYENGDYSYFWLCKLNRKCTLSVIEGRGYYSDKAYDMFFEYRYKKPEDKENTTLIADAIVEDKPDYNKETIDLYMRSVMIDKSDLANSKITPSKIYKEIEITDKYRFLNIALPPRNKRP